MGLAEILSQIDREIEQLQRARTLLNGGNGHKATNGKNGFVKAAAKSKRHLTPEGRKRISEAVRRRWERERKTAAAASK